MTTADASKQFSEQDIPDMASKIAIVTGGTSGIGYAIALQLAKAGANVIITARNDEKGQKSVADIKTELGAAAKISYSIMNNEDLFSVESFARSFGEVHETLDILVNNAGIGMPPWRSINGIESQIMVNYLSHFHLTNLLLPKLRKAGELHGDARIVNVSSVGHRYAKPSSLNPNVPGWEEANDEATYESNVNYGFSKLGQIHQATVLTKQLGSTSNVRINSCHPGSIRTNIAGPDKVISGSVGHSIAKYLNSHGASSDWGALTPLYLATSPEIVDNDIRGKYFVPIAVEEEPTPLAKSEEGAIWTWAWSEAAVARLLQQ
ncbi:uncharacterized protein BJ171DRAFT_440222 [Polychytrium aggregatum]|uniref:uncharacterized protein n=1 Tax=Polychytrium aggregatum TaxID=110093 RepID=UPI0022FEFECD|nr:uncharacterized protein BJ171DRAFT_440222 [Polychytrium aggregatum]KAI9206713.1 hypothetical protein BJ171DRAFT_440222 [Polychytrium aggregatum]